MTIQAVNFGLNQYCGPAVLSALTGESTDRCAAVISAVSGQQEIKAVSREHLREALKRLRFDVDEASFEGSSLYGTLFRMHTYDGLYIVFVHKHVVAVEVKDGQIYICDNHTKTPLDIRQSARLSQKVEKVWRVTAHEPPKFIRSIIRLDKYSDTFYIRRCNIYENLEDNVEESLGYIKYKDNEELKQIIRELKESVEFGDWE